MDGVKRTSPAEHGPDPVIDLDARGHPDRHGGDAEDRVHVRALPHGEEVVQPDGEGEDRDRRRGDDQRDVAVKFLGREGGDDLGIHAEGRQDQDVDLGMTEQPEQVDVVHHVAAEIVGEEVHSGVTVGGQQQRRQGERRHGEDHQDGGAERRPAEQRHAHPGHARGAELVDRAGDVDADRGAADRRQGHRPDPVIRPRSAAERQLGIGRVSAPAAGGEFAHDQGGHHQPRATRSQP